MQIRWMMVVVCVVGLGVFGPAACSDDSTTGPRFGDLEFTPSFENIDNERSIELVLTNAGSIELTAIMVGTESPKNIDSPQGLTCPTMTRTVTPSNVASLAPGADAVIDISIDTSGVDPDICEPAQYDLDVFAAVDELILGGATVRFNWAGSDP